MNREVRALRGLLGDHDPAASIGAVDPVEDAHATAALRAIVATPRPIVLAERDHRSKAAGRRSVRRIVPALAPALAVLIIDSKTGAPLANEQILTTVEETGPSPGAVRGRCGTDINDDIALVIGNLTSVQPAPARCPLELLVNRGAPRSLGPHWRAVWARRKPLHPTRPGRRLPPPRAPPVPFSN